MTTAQLDLIATRPTHWQPGHRAVAVSPAERDALVALAREAIRLRQQATCKVCRRVEKFNFTVPDAVWQAVVPLEYQNRVVCLACFDDFAAVHGIDYAESLSAVHFAGRRAAFEVHPAAVVVAEGTQTEEQHG